MKSFVFLVITICLLNSFCSCEDAPNSTDKVDSLMVFGSAKRAFFTNISQIIFSVNCEIPLSKDGTNATNATSTTKKDLLPYLQSRAADCESKVTNILNELGICNCEDCRDAKDVAVVDSTKLENGMIRSEFVFTPMYELAPHHRLPVCPRRPRRFHISPRQSPSTPFRPAPPASPISSAALEPKCIPHNVIPARHLKIKPKIHGYFARQMVQICIPTSRAGLLLDRLVENNATIYRIRSILSTSSMNLLQKSCQKDAISNALYQADTILEDMNAKRTSYTIDITRVVEPQYTSLDVYGMDFLPRLFVSKREIEANVRLVVSFHKDDLSSPKIRKEKDV